MPHKVLNLIGIMKTKFRGSLMLQDTNMRNRIRRQALIYPRKPPIRKVSKEETERRDPSFETCLLLLSYYLMQNTVFQQK